MEIWKDISNYEGLYQVSNEGRVKSLARRKKGGILKNLDNGKGYQFVILRTEGVPVMKRVNRLVAIAFIPNPENKPDINHIDGIKTNNYICNLEWLTKSENQIHAYKMGLKAPQKGEANGRSKLKESQVRKIRQIYSLGETSQSKLGLKFGVAQSTIGMIINHKKWVHI